MCLYLYHRCNEKSQLILQPETRRVARVDSERRLLRADRRGSGGGGMQKTSQPCGGVLPLCLGFVLEVPVLPGLALLYRGGE